MDHIVFPEGVELRPLKIFSLESGDVMHALKKTDEGFKKFGEAYFSVARQNHVKGWKRHVEMTLNLIVPVGEIEFVFYDDRVNSKTEGSFFSVILSIDNYKRLTVPPMVWMAFKGIGRGVNVVLNIADIPHDPDEVDHRALEHFSYSWK